MVGFRNFFAAGHTEDLLRNLPVEQFRESVLENTPGPVLKASLFGVPRRSTTTTSTIAAGRPTSRSRCRPTCARASMPRA